jgi:hypothetical protein
LGYDDAKITSVGGCHDTTRSVDIEEQTAADVFDKLILLAIPIDRAHRGLEVLLGLQRKVVSGIVHRRHFTASAYIRCKKS